jgi:hypothetical protein
VKTSASRLGDTGHSGHTRAVARPPGVLQGLLLCVAWSLLPACLLGVNILIITSKHYHTQKSKNKPRFEVEPNFLPHLMTRKSSPRLLGAR